MLKKTTIFMLSLFLTVIIVKSAGASAQKDSMAKLAATMLPGATIDGFHKTPIPGIFEIDAQGQVFYYSPKGYLIIGEIYDKQGHNLTAVRRAQFIAEKLKSLPLNKAITIGNGPHQVIEFTDPDCPFCRQVDAYLNANAAYVTRHVFLYSLGIHSNSRDHALYILSAKNKVRAMREVYSGKWDKRMPTFKLRPGAVSLLDEYLKLGDSLGVQTTPTLWVDGRRIQGENIEAIDAIINKQK